MPTPAVDEDVQCRVAQLLQRWTEPSRSLVANAFAEKAEGLTREINASTDEGVLGILARLSGISVSTQAASSTPGSATGPATLDELTATRMAELTKWAHAVLERGMLLDKPVSADQQERAEKMKTYVCMPDLGDYILPSLCQSFYNRPVYARLVKKILSRQLAVLTGDPGVGKSTLLLRLICRLAADGRKVLIRYHVGSVSDPDTQLYVDFQNPADIKVDWTDSNDCQRFKVYQADLSVVVVKDGPGHKPSLPKQQNVICVSPDANNWKFLSKLIGSLESNGLDALYVDWWQEDELIEAAYHKGIISSMDDPDGLEMIRARIHRHGRNARMVLNDFDLGVTKLMSLMSIEDAKSIVWCQSQGALSQLHHRFFHAVVDENDDLVGYEPRSAMYFRVAQQKLDQHNFYQSSADFKTHAADPRKAMDLARKLQDRVLLVARQGLEALNIRKMTAADVQELAKSADISSEVPGLDVMTNAAASSNTPSAKHTSTTTAKTGTARPARRLGTDSLTTGTRPSQSTKKGAGSTTRVIKVAAGKTGKSAAAVAQIKKNIAQVFNRPHVMTLDCGMALLTDCDRTYEPVNVNQGAWDLLIFDTVVGWVIIQVTYSLTHDFKIEYIEELLQRIHEADPDGKWDIHIVFAVPEYPQEIFDTYQAPKYSSRPSQHGQRTVLDWSEVSQQLRDIPMWVVRVPLIPEGPHMHPSAALSREEQVLREKWQIIAIMEMSVVQLKKELLDLVPPGRTHGTRRTLVRRLMYCRKLISVDPDPHPVAGAEDPQPSAEHHAADCNLCDTDRVGLA